MFFLFRVAPMWSKVSPFMMHRIPSRRWGSRIERYHRSWSREVQTLLWGPLQLLGKIQLLSFSQNRRVISSKGFTGPDAANMKLKHSESFMRNLFTPMEVKLGMEGNYFHNFGQALLFSFSKEFSIIPLSHCSFFYLLGWKVVLEPLFSFLA